MKLAPDRESLYNAVNNMSSTKLKINDKLLDYLSGEGKFLLESTEKLSKSELLQREILRTQSK